MLSLDKFEDIARKKLRLFQNINSIVNIVFK